MADEYKYHIDHHSSLIPPVELVAARAARARGEVTTEELRAAEDKAIQEALHMQKRATLSAVSDGQLRRRHALAPVYRIDGFAAEAAPVGPLAELLGPHLAPESRALLGTPAARGRLVADETAFLTSATQHPLMLALPSPGYVLALGEGASGRSVPDSGAALASILRDEINHVAAEGIAYVQLHNPLTGVLLTVAGRDRARAAGIEPQPLLERMLEADGAAISGLNVPEHFRVALDLTTAGALDMRGGYDVGAVAGFLARQPFDRLCVEYPAQESDRFPIELLKPGTIVALGIVDVSRPEPEDVDDLVARIDKAATIIDIDDIAVSTNGGFTASPAVLSADQQRAKLQLIEMTARYTWGNEL